MAVKKESKDEIISLLLQNVPTDEIARRLHYSVGTIRKVFEELREEYGVNTTRDIVNIYFLKELTELSEKIEKIRKILGSRKIATTSKRMPRMQKKGKNKK